MTPHEILHRVFGHAEFRDPQEQIISDVIAGRDCLAIMPTGAGKSLCYQVPALVRPGTALVISPLIALMEDQVQALHTQGVRAGTLICSMSRRNARCRMVSARWCSARKSP